MSSGGVLIYACVFRKNLDKTTSSSSKSDHSGGEELILETPEEEQTYSIELVADSYYGLNVCTGPGMSQEFSEPIARTCRKVVELLFKDHTRLANNGKLSLQQGHLLINCWRSDPMLYLLCSEEELKRRIAFKFLDELQSDIPSTSDTSNENTSEEEKKKRLEENNALLSKKIRFFNDEYVDPLIKLQQEMANMQSDLQLGLIDRILQGEKK